MRIITLVVGFLLSAGTPLCSALAFEDGAAECPATWTFAGRSLPLEASELLMGVLVQSESESTWQEEHEGWVVFDMSNKLRRRPASLLCSYQSENDLHDVIVRLPDSVSTCVLHWKDKDDEHLLSTRCVWPMGEGKAEAFVPQPLQDDADVMGLRIRQGEAALQAVVTSRGGRWTLHRETAEKVAKITFPDSPAVFTVWFAAGSGKSREIEVREPLSERSDLASLMVQRYGVPGFSTGCIAWDKRGLRIEYGAISRSVRLLRLLDMTDPATKAWSDDLVDPS